MFGIAEIGTNRRFGAGKFIGRRRILKRDVGCEAKWRKRAGTDPYAWTPPTQRSRWEVDQNPRERPYRCFSTTVGGDLAKNAIHSSAVNSRGQEHSNRALTRKQFAELLGTQKTTLIAYKSCPTAHYWARAAERHGHERVGILVNECVC